MNPLGERGTGKGVRAHPKVLSNLLPLTFLFFLILMPGVHAYNKTTYIPFDEETGFTAADIWGANDATLSSGVRWIPGGHLNGALNFTGIVSANDSHANTTLYINYGQNSTLNFWIRSNNSGGSATEYIYGDLGGGVGVQVHIDKTTGYIGWLGFPGPTAVTATQNINDGNYHMVTFKRNISGAIIKTSIYIDGIINISSSTGTIGTSGCQLTLGNTVSTGCAPRMVAGDIFNGSIDELKFFNGTDELTDTQIMNLYLYNDIDGAGAAKVISFNKTLNTTTYNITFDIATNNTNASYVWINTTDKHGYNNNVTANLTYISNYSNGSLYNYSTHIHNLGYGNFSVIFYNSTGGAIDYAAGLTGDLNLNYTTPIVIKLQDSVSAQALGSTAFTTTNTNQTTGATITENYTTNATGEYELTIYKVGNMSTITIATSGLSGYYDSSNEITIAKTLPQRANLNIEPIGAASQIIIEVVDSIT